MQWKQAKSRRRCRLDKLTSWSYGRRFAYDRAYRWCRAMEGRGGMVLEDYIQVAFLALLEALESWDPAAGAFLTWYGLKLKGAFTEAVGMRTQRDKRDPIHHALSLDAPLTDSESGEDFTLADVIEDPYAAAGVEAVAELDKYLDDAYIAHMKSVRIVHGKGTGALRKGVHNYLKRQKHVASFRLGEFGEGDAGVTIVEFKK